MDLKKIFEIAKMPAIALSVLWFVGIAVELLGYGSEILAFLVGVLSLSAVLYAGYITTKMRKMRLRDAAAVGITVALILTVVITLLVMVLLFAGITPDAALFQEMIVEAGIGAIVQLLLLNLIINCVIAALFGIFLGLIGGFIGQKF